MKKIVTVMTLVALFFSPALHGDSPPEQTAPKEVSKVSEEEAKQGKKSHWTQYGVAIGVVAVAILCLVLVKSGDSSHHGH